MFPPRPGDRKSGTSGTGTHIYIGGFVPVRQGQSRVFVPERHKDNNVLFVPLLSSYFVLIHPEIAMLGEPPADGFFGHTEVFGEVFNCDRFVNSTRFVGGFD